MQGAYNCGALNDHGFDLQQELSLPFPLENLPQRSQFGGFENSVVGLPQQNSSTTVNNNSWGNDAFALGNQLERQGQNIDTLLELQEIQIQKMRPAMQQEMQQMVSAMRETEARAVILLNQKDEEIARLNKRTLELKEFKRQAEADMRAWQTIAEGRVVVITALRNTINQLKNLNEAMFTASNGVPPPLDFGGGGDIGSLCGSNWPVGQKATEVEVGESSGCQKMKTCSVCNSRNPCVSFHTCGHLSLCEECAAFADACLVCATPSQSKIVMRID